MFRSRSSVLAAVSLMFIAGACSTTSSSNDIAPQPMTLRVGNMDVALTSVLQSYNDCDALLNDIHATALNKVTPYGFDTGYYPFVDMPVLRGDMVSDAVPESSMAPPQPGIDFSTTNNQEVAVDEADIVKTDGQWVYLIVDQSLVVVSTATKAISGKVSIPKASRHEIIVSESTVLVVSESYAPVSRTSESLGSSAPYVIVSRYTVSSSGVPSFQDAFSMSGRYVSSRLIGTTVHVVSSASPAANIPFVYPRSPASEETALAANRAAIMETTLDDWVPTVSTLDSDGEPRSTRTLSDCDEVHLPSQFSGMDTTSIVSIDLVANRELSTATILSSATTVYVSPTALYVAAQVAPDVSGMSSQDQERVWENRRTSLHKIDLTPTGPRYASSGSVPGDIRDQFSLSEHKDHLRVVATTGTGWDESSTSSVHVLHTRGVELVEVGVVGDIGRGEDVQSVRFIADRGYVVTFRQIDPFYTLDLSDPTTPTILGELKIPGFSSYLHPLDDTRVLGVGSDATETGRVTGAKVSVFDVSDPANPVESAIWSAPGSWSAVGFDHRAFLWFNPTQTAVVPVSTYEPEPWAGAVVLRIDGTDIYDVGRIEHESPPPPPLPCPSIDRDGLPDTDATEFLDDESWLLADPGSQLIRCAPGVDPSLTDPACTDMPYRRNDIVDRVLPDPTTEESIYVCLRYRPTPRPIERTFIVNATELWSLSYSYEAGVTANLLVVDVETLAHLDTIHIAN